MSVSRFDKLYRRIILSQMFTKGWGNPDHLLRLFKFRKVLSNRESCYNLVSKNYPVTIINNQSIENNHILEGKFLTPLATLLPGIVPQEVKYSYFQLIFPKYWNSTKHQPVCIHFAGTGDHNFWRRRNVMAKPLLKSDIGAIILENPFYGLRKPKNQIRSSLHYVSDILVMGSCLMLESLVLLHWCERMGFGPLGVSGLSMGGHMASLAATNWPKPLVLVPCLSWSTASSVFTEGVLSDSINWDHLQQQFVSDSRYGILAKYCEIVDDTFQCPFSRIPEWALKNLDMDMISMCKTLTPYDMVKFIRKSSIEYNKNIVFKKNAPLPPHIFKLVKSFKAVFSKIWEYSEMKTRNKEALWFMRGIMDECTHLGNFSIPFDTSLVIAICATSDAYVPRKGCTNLKDLWPGSTIRYLNGGHIGAFLWHQKEFRKAIVEDFEKAKRIIPPP